MKSKLGGLDKVKKLKYEGYKGLLKKSLISIIKTGQENLYEFVLIHGSKLPWMGGVDDSQPMLYIGNIKEWKAEIKKMEMDMKDYAFGTCKVSKNDNNAKIEICTDKGKLTDGAKLKPVEKIFFTKFKPKIELVPVDKLEGNVSEEAPEPVDEEEDDDTDENNASVETEDSVTETAIDFQSTAKEIITEFKSVQAEYDREKAIKVFKNINSWLNAYKVAEEPKKLTFKDISENIQKIAVYLKNAIQIDQAIDKEIEPLYKIIDKHNDLVERGNPEAAKLKTNILSSFDKISKMATDIKDSSLAEVIADFKSQLK
jgi:hypothetical protein